jgi:capsular exopolysaccharide synthesis family protein
MQRQSRDLVPITEHLETRPVPDPLRFIDTSRHENLDIARYLRIFRRHIRLIALIIGVALLVGAVKLARSPRIYDAEATLLVTAPEPDVIVGRDVALEEGETVATSDYYKTQCDILKSRSLAAHLVTALGLYGASVARFDGITSADDHEHIRRAVDAYLGGLDIKPLNGTSLIGVGYSSPDPVFAAKIANAHATMFIKEHLDMLRQRKEDVAGILSVKLAELKKRLEASEVALNAYRRDSGIIPGLMSLNGKNAIVIDRLTQLSSQLTTVQVKRIELESQIELIRRRDYSSLPAVVADPMSQGLERELDELAAQDRTLSSRFTPDYPEVASLHAKIRGVQTQLNTEIARKVDSIELEYDAELKEENQLQDEVNKQRVLTMALNDAGVKYAMLQRDVDANSELYESVLKGMKDARVAADSQASNVAMVDRAEVPDIPSEPKAQKIIGISLVFGLFGAFTAALGLDYLRDPVDDPQEVARLFHLPTLAVIPRLQQVRANRSIIKYVSNGANGAGPNDREKAAALPAGTYATADGAYGQLAASLLLAQHKRSQVILITSSVPSEGKTQTAVGTAISLARHRRRVLLVDADLRRPRCHQYLGVQNNEGLACVFTNESPPHSFVQPTAIETLHFLSAGRISQSPSEFMSSACIREILDNLSLTYSFIIIDSCPVVPISDAVMLGAIVDGVVLVVDSNKTSKQVVRLACTRLSHARANIIGLVLNNSITDDSYYKHYYRHYSGYEQ